MNNNYLFNYKPPTRLRPLPTGLFSDFGKWNAQMKETEPFPFSDSCTYPQITFTDLFSMSDSANLSIQSFYIIETVIEGDSGSIPGSVFTFVDSISFNDEGNPIMQTLSISDSFDFAESFTFIYAENEVFSFSDSGVLPNFNGTESGLIADSVTFVTPSKDEKENFFISDTSENILQSFVCLESIIESTNGILASYKTIEGFFLSDSVYPPSVGNPVDNFIISDSAILSKYVNTDMMPTSDNGTLIKP